MKAKRLWHLYFHCGVWIPWSHRRSACSSGGSFDIEAPSCARTLGSSESPGMKPLDMFSFCWKEASEKLDSKELSDLCPVSVLIWGRKKRDPGNEVGNDHVKYLNIPLKFPQNVKEPPLFGRVSKPTNFTTPWLLLIDLAAIMLLW